MIQLSLRTTTVIGFIGFIIQLMGTSITQSRMNQMQVTALRSNTYLWWFYTFYFSVVMGSQMARRFKLWAFVPHKAVSS
jgi:hypothetical protein